MIEEKVYNDYYDFKNNYMQSTANITQEQAKLVCEKEMFKKKTLTVTTYLKLAGTVLMKEILPVKMRNAFQANLSLITDFLSKNPPASQYSQFLSLFFEYL